MFLKPARILGIAGVLMSAGSVSAKPTGYDVAFPTGFQDWHVVNSMIVTKDSPSFAQIGGMHIIYVNAKGLPALKKGGSFPFPDGTVFADDVREFTVKDGSYIEGTKKAVTVMVKNAAKFASTGGWGFQVWAGGDPAKPLLPDVAHASQACFTCHTPQKAQDFTFSTYLH